MIEPKAVGEDKTEERAEFIVCYWKRFTISICIINVFVLLIYKCTNFMNEIVFWLALLFNFHFGFFYANTNHNLQ